MYYDYARRYSPVLRSRQKIVARGGYFQAGSASLRGALGWTVASGLVVVLSCCFMLGIHLRRNETELMLQQASQRRLELVEQELVTQRDQLLSRPRIENAVKHMGLFSPAAEQIVPL